MNYIVYELIPLVVLLVFAIRGLRRGLIKSLFSLVAVLVAFVGAILMANFLTPPVSEWVQPMLQPTIENALQSALPEEGGSAELSLDNVLQSLEQADLPLGLHGLLDNIQNENDAIQLDSLAQDVAGVLTEKLSNTITYAVLFLLAFLLILILWSCLARTLNLVAKLPVLNGLNRIGGFAFGLIFGAIILFVCAWVVRWLFLDWIGTDVIEQTRLLRFFMTVNPLDYLAKL